MALNVNPNTLFHLVPKNQTAHDALLHPDNKRFVSPSAAGSETPGLEIGFHVPSIASGRVITRLGRDADLILRERPVSAVHVAFEIHPETLVVLLSVRSKNLSSVTVATLEEAGNQKKSQGKSQGKNPEKSQEKNQKKQQKIDGDCVIVYGQNYHITIVSYAFDLVWREIGTIGGSESRRALAIQGYQDSLQRLRNVRSRDLPTDFDESELHTWHNTRLHTAKKELFREANGEPRVLIGQGNFGNVFRAVDLISGNPFAVKVVKLEKYPNIEQARASLHREVKTLERLKHKNIVEYLGTDKWDTLVPEIFMPLRPGNLRLLAAAEGRPCSDDSMCMQVLEQVLSALDHLAYHGLCHRDVKPENILCWEKPGQGSYGFQLADFGLVNHQRFATTVCGTGFYQAPELYPEYGRFPQSPKMDVWSLFATIIDVNGAFSFPPWGANSYREVLQAIRTAVVQLPNLGDMARENPAHRASAAQMLVIHFGGQGLTTPRAAVPPIAPQPEEAGPAEIQPSDDVLKSMPVPQAPVPQAPVEAPIMPSLIVYPVRRDRRAREAAARPQTTRTTHRDGIVKARAPSTMGGKKFEYPYKY